MIFAVLGMKSVICDNVGREDEILPEELPEAVRPLVVAYRKKKA